MTSSSVISAERGRVIVALGDSTTAGTPGFASPREAPPSGRGDRKSQYAYWMMRMQPTWTVVNMGVNGQRSDQILARFDTDVVQMHPHDVIVLAGVNDLFQGYDAKSIIKNLKKIYKVAHSAKINVVACTVLPYAGMAPATYLELQKLNHWIRNNARREKLILCDTFRLLEDPAHQGQLVSTPDGLHPDVEGYKKMGQLIAGRMEKGSQS
jgi:lysophospholipase L1-like esterase